MFKLYDDSTFINLDDYVREVNAGLPASKYKMNDILADGSLISGVGFLDGRVFEISNTFMKLYESERKLLLEWFIRPPYKNLWLERATTNFTGRVKVKAALTGGEKYNIRNYQYSDAVGFELYAEDPYFTSTSLTSTSIILTSSTEQSGTVNLLGAKNYCSFSLSSTAAWTLFQVKLDEDYGFRFEYGISAGSTVEVSTTGSEIITRINNNRVFGGLSSNSTPFELNSSNNTLYITGAAGTMTISYYQRQL